jgi:hypothetical protein
MAAMKRFYENCAMEGRCPISPRTFNYLNDLESIDATIDWIVYCEHDYRSAVTGLLVSHDCITMKSARRLVAIGLANAEIGSFVDNFGDYCPA